LGIYSEARALLALRGNPEICDCRSMSKGHTTVCPVVVALFRATLLLFSCCTSAGPEGTGVICSRLGRRSLSVVLCNYLAFGFEPKFKIATGRATGFLPKFVGARPNSGMTHYLSQLSSELFGKFSKTMRCRMITGKASSSGCKIDLMLNFSSLIHGTPHKKHGLTLG
jgi:hypothetical protein